MSSFSSTTPSNAICRPSGDQRGAPPFRTKYLSFAPLESQIRIKPPGARDDVNTTCVPSGEIAGVRSYPSEERYGLGAGPAGAEIQPPEAKARAVIGVGQPVAPGAE